ncbi:hypothetical protein ACFT9J_10795 [Streptomyces anthocyanicus]|uniref:hypothetical protein n=1 Tax=Streptomyces anthocyanicus TaxID=68174 RepID=UPI0036288C4E
MNDSTLGKPASEEGEPTSFAEKTKYLCRKHKGKFLAAGGMALAIVAVVVRHAMEQSVAESAEEQEPSPAPETTDQSRRSSLDPDRDPFLRRLPVGQHASEEAKARYRELTGNEIPPGYTLVRRWLFVVDSSEDEDPGEAAA